MNREELIQQVIEDASRLKRVALADRSHLMHLQLSMAQLELTHLICFHDKLSGKHASQILGVSTSAVSQLADSLQTEGYIKRVADPKDRRLNYMALTPKAQKTIESLRKGGAGGFRSALEGLDKKDLLELSRIYKKMAAGINKKKE